jgi:hypothetical protein
MEVLKRFIRVVRNFILRKQIGKRLRKQSGQDIRMSTRINITLPDCKQHVKRKTSPQELSDRCRELVQKITRKVDDPVAQRVHCENAERMVLASFVSGLNGLIGKHTRYASPSSMQQALQIALAVEQAEKQERFYESFYTRFQKSVRLTSQSPSSTYAGSSTTWQSADARASRQTQVINTRAAKIEFKVSGTRRLEKR